MQFKPTHRRIFAADSAGSSPDHTAPAACWRPPAHRRRTGGFTLAETLAALLFMAIVIPVAIEGLRIANLAGVVGQRKGVAARIADSKLNEIVGTGQGLLNSQRGTVVDNGIPYDWECRADPWPYGSLRLLTVRVAFTAQGQLYEVPLSTVVDLSSQ